MRPPVDLVVPNLSEFNARRFSGELDPLVERDFHAVSMHYGDQSLLWSDRERVIVLPPGLDRRWLSDICADLGDPEPAIITPEPHCGGLVGDLLRGAAGLAALRGALGDPRPVRLLSWGASPQLYGLVAAVTSWGHQVTTELPAEADYWTSAYLDTKLSGVDLVTALPTLRVPQSWTVGGFAELRGVVELLLATAGGAVVKAPLGVGGEGFRIVRASDELDALWRHIGESPFFGHFPVLVQEFVATVDRLDTPSVDLLIGADGVAATITSVIGGAGRQLLTLGRGTGILPEALEERAHGTARAIAGQAHALGYRGWLGVDFLSGADGELYLLELNARRTGGVHAAALLERRPDWATAVACVDDAVAIDRPGPLSYLDIRAAFPPGGPVLASTVRGLNRERPTVGLVSLGPDVITAERLLIETRAALTAVTT